MSRVIIKASVANYVDEDTPLRPHVFPDTIEIVDEIIPKEEIGEAEEEGGEPSEQEHTGAVSEEDLQAAYDELIATAQDEVLLLLDDARAEATELLQSAEKQSADIKKQAEEEGYNDGLEKARQELESVFEQADIDADLIIQKANSAYEAKVRECEPQIIQLSLDIASKILNYELKNNDKAFMSILRNALDNVRDSKRILLHVNLEEYEKCFNSRDFAKIRTPSANISVQVVVDPTVPAGGALIETDSGAIDTGVDAQIGQMANALGLKE